MTATAHDLLVLLHVGVGFFALVALWVPLFSTKGGGLHRRVGKAYAVAMLIVVVTAVGASLLAFVHPLGVDEGVRELSAEDRAAGAAPRRTFAVFLSYLALVTFASGWLGLGALRHKEDPRKLGTRATKTIFAVTALAGVGVLVFGAVRESTLLMALSLIGPAVAWNGLRYVSRPAESRMAWWYAHMGGMIATGIAANTAFLVFGANRLLPFDLQAGFGVVAWLLPTLIGTPAIWYLERRYRRRFGEEKSDVAARART